MLTFVLTSFAIIAAWTFAGALGYIWYKRLEPGQGQVPERIIMLLLGPVGLCMLLICTAAQVLIDLCTSSGGKNPASS